jgi:hypothetical protein
MTTIAKLLAEKEQLITRRESGTGQGSGLCHQGHER